MVMLFAHNPDEIRNNDPNNIGRVIRFGSTHSIGRIDFVDPNRGAYIYHSGSGVEAVGDVPVPIGMNCHLRIGGFGSTDLSPLANIQSDDLREIVFECELDDFQLKHFVHLTELRWLGTHGFFVSEFGLSFIGQMKGLELLNLSDSNVEDLGVEKLSQLQLEILYLGGRTTRGTRVTDRGLKAISKMHTLRILELPQSSNEQSIELLGELKLKTLMVQKGQLSEACISKIIERGIAKEVSAQSVIDLSQFAKP